MLGEAGKPVPPVLADDSAGRPANQASAAGPAEGPPGRGQAAGAGPAWPIDAPPPGPPVGPARPLGNTPTLRPSIDDLESIRDAADNLLITHTSHRTILDDRACWPRCRCCSA